MADIKKELNDIKNAVYGREVRGSIHDGLKKINDEVENATDLSESAKHQVENIQQQVNQLVVEGDSSVEAAQARVDADGNTFTTLKERLDTKETQFAARLADIMNMNPINLRDYKVHHLNTAEQNTQFIKQAIADAEAEQRPIMLPWVPEGHWIKINEPLKIVNGNIGVYGFGNQSRIRQEVFPNPIFEVEGANVEIDGFYASGVPYDATGTGVDHANYSGVLVKADNVKVRNVKAYHLSTGVNVTGNPDSNHLLENVSVENIEVDKVVFGLLVSGTKGFYFNNIRGSYELLPTVTTAPHLVYFRERFGKNYDVIGGDCYAFNGKHGQAFQFKGVENAEIRNLFASGCYGSLSMSENKNVHIESLTSINDKHDSQNYGSLEMFDVNENVEIDSAKIEVVDDGKAVRLGNETSNIKIRNLEVITNHINAEIAEETYDVDVQGINNIVDNVVVENIGSEPMSASVGIWRGQGNIIKNPKTKGNRRGVAIRTGQGHKLEDFLESDLDFVEGYTDSKPFSIGSSAEVELIEKGVGFVEPQRLIAYDRCNISTPGGVIHHTTSGHEWVQDFGIWKNDGKRMFCEIGSRVTAYIDTANKNIEFKAGITYADREYLVLRAINKDNTLLVGLDHRTSVLRIAKFDGGADAPLTSLAETDFNVQIGRRYDFKVIIFNDLIEVFVDGVKFLDHTLSSDDMTKFNTSNFGVGGYSAEGGYFDSLEWRSIE